MNEIYNMGLQARYRRVFITPNQAYYREKNSGYGWSIIAETPNEIMWSVCDVRKAWEQNNRNILNPIVRRK